MSVWEVIVSFFSVLGLSITNLMIFILLLGCLVMAATNFRVGAMVAFILMAGAFVAFEVNGLDSQTALLVFLIIGIILSLSIYIGFGKRQVAGGVQ